MEDRKYTNGLRLAMSAALGSEYRAMTMHPEGHVTIVQPQRIEDPELRRWIGGPDIRERVRAVLGT